MTTRRWLTVVVFVAVGTVACLGDPPAPMAPDDTPVDLSGTWTGSVTELLAPVADCTTGQLVVTLSQSGNTLTGSWSLVYPDTSCNGNGPVTGSNVGNVVDITLTSTSSDSCSIRLDGSLSGNRQVISGEYEPVSCPTPGRGSFDLALS